VAEEPDIGWWRTVAERGEDAAARADDIDALIGLLGASARTFETVDDVATAEEQWQLALRLSLDFADARRHERVVAILTALVSLYRTAGWPEEEMDALIELADVFQAEGDHVGRAQALARLADLKLRASRPDRAVVYLTRADELLAEALLTVAADDPSLGEAIDEARAEVTVVHSRVLEQLGRVLWQLNKRINARRSFRRALELLGEHDPLAAQRLTELLATPTSADLPT
jgi:tetratricopeptide (TPR) repeat protein